MNLFQLVADVLHLSSFFIIINQILKTKSVQELSYRTQEIYLVVFCFRYMDLFLYYISLYNTIFKILFISATAVIIYLIKFKKPYSLGYDPNLDRFNHYMFIYPLIIIVTVMFHITDRTPYLWYEYMWSFSIWLEAVAIVPQLYIGYKKREVEIITGSYMAILGSYKIFYIMSWIYQLVNNHTLIWIKFIAGIIQILIYSQFLYFYFISAKISANTMKLPV